LVSWFQKRNGNGGMGVCFATVLSELIVVALGFYLVPRNVLERKFLRSVLVSFAAGAVMAGASYLLKPHMPALLSAGCVSVLYFGVLWLLGGLEPQYVNAVREKLGNKLARFRGR
jgi:hypothetical protein